MDAWRSARANPSGKRGVTFRLQDAFVDQPLQLPCGKCVGCQADKAREWAIRIYHESTLHAQNAFLTLTYENNPDTLVARDLQLFLKRLRHIYRLRYFAIGEYGDRSHRPHFHAIVFGTDFRELSYAINDKLYGSPVVDAEWGKGLCAIAPVSMATCMYVARYCQKKAGTEAITMMSRRPGIGHTWLDRYHGDLTRTGSVVIEGREYPVPRRYIDWREDDFEQLRRDRRNHILSMSPEERWQRAQLQRGKEINYKARELPQGNV